MDIMEQLKSFDNVISAIDYLHHHLQNCPIQTNFDVERLRLIGINACDNESNTYLWHINALIHASIDLDHLLLGLEMMLHRFLKSSKHITNHLNTSQISRNAHSIVSIGDDGNHFLRLKSRTPSHSPKKRKGSKRNNNISIPLHIPSATTTTATANVTTTTTNINNNSIDEIANIANMANMGNISNMSNISNTNRDDVIENIDNIDINDINSIIAKEAINNMDINDDDKDKRGEISVSGIFGDGNALQIMQGPIKIGGDDNNNADYIAQLLVSPDSTRLNSPSRAAMSAVESVMLGADNIFSVKIQSSPNASRMKRIKRIRQQERNYQNKIDEKQKNNNINNSNGNNGMKNIIYNGVNGMVGGVNNGENSGNGMNRIDNMNVGQEIGEVRQVGQVGQNGMEMSPFEISKFVKQVDQLQI